MLYRRSGNEKVLGLPRYLLFNESGTLLLDNADRPSSGEKLFKQIKNKLAAVSINH
ncbi:hypothetical protein [Chitinophaga nivalis]|uniref:Uncharacterized protein n=1 Tax=Chitinophaga nivalis TaxID=2991709 RepID=A0ABT3IJL1_9BACT|nr:hypothetical protein [Chitinophaga nivalis]MCW3466149.1 hypothetical protein [Chitinophaga nivalis]MCW3484160.1 hypothetical protein [Chitinophaga nivalis]